MINLRVRWAGSRADRPQEGGYVAVMTALLLVVLMGLSAFAVDVGNWYVVGQQEQRAADAAALAGVTRLPGDSAGAFAVAQNFSKINGFLHDGTVTTVTPALDGRPTRLRVTVSRKVKNIFGPLLGVAETTIARTAVADFGGPVPMGSPCNEFGDDPDAGTNRSTNCDNAGAFWANIGAVPEPKKAGDAYQSKLCVNGEDSCTGGVNDDYDPDGYIYTVKLTRAVTNLQIQAFDPAQVVVGDTCTNATGSTGNNLTAAAALGAKAVVSDPSVRYVPVPVYPPPLTPAQTAAVAAATVWCTGDRDNLLRTQFTVHDPGLNDWDPKNWPIHCQQTFQPFKGNLSKALDQTQPVGTFRPDVAANFRRWVNLCSYSGTVPAGTYAIQVKTNGLLADDQSGHNRFGLRAVGSGPGDNDVISVAGFTKMGLYANTPNGTSKFFLAKVPSDVKGQLFNIRLFDIGDGATSGSTIKVLPPTEVGGDFVGCTGAGVKIGPLPNCQFGVSSAFNGKWQTISVPIPASYACTDTSPTGCWVRLEFFYGAGSSPADATSWSAGLGGDPVRLVE